MQLILSLFLRSLNVPMIGIVTGLTLYYQFVLCWFRLPRAHFILVCCLVVPALFFTAPLAQFGHVIGACLGRLMVTQVSVFGLALERVSRSGSWRIRRMPSVCCPPSTVAMARDGKGLRRRHLYFVLGGVGIQFVVAIVCLTVGQAIYSPPETSVRFLPPLAARSAFCNPNTPLIATLNLFAIANVGFGLSSLVLSNPGTIRSAGNDVLDLLCDPLIDRHLAMVYLGCWLRFGVRPRDWGTDLVARLEGPGSPATEIRAALFLYYFHEDWGATEVAERQLNRAINLFGWSKAMPSVLAVEAAYVAGVHHRDRDRACAWLSQVDLSGVESHTRDRAEAAALLAEQRFDEAITTAERGMASSLKSVDSGGYTAERDWLQHIIDVGRRSLEAKD